MFSKLEPKEIAEAIVSGMAQAFDTETLRTIRDAFYDQMNEAIEDSMKFDDALILPETRERRPRRPDAPRMRQERETVAYEYAPKWSRDLDRRVADLETEIGFIRQMLNPKS